MMIDKLLISLAAGLAAAKLTEKQQSKIIEKVNNTLVSDFEIDKRILDSINLPRGIRNNNPGNIKYDGTKWLGLDNPPSDGVFCRFIEPSYGVRAMARILKSYKNRGIDSVSEIIKTWAPASENDTKSYIEHVSKKMDVLELEKIDQSRWPELIEVIIKHENGMQPYSIAEIKEGVLMA